MTDDEDIYALSPRTTLQSEFVAISNRITQRLDVLLHLTGGTGSPLNTFDNE
jgi:hypothetical protein